MENVNQFLRSSKTIIRKDRRDRLTSPFLVPKKVMLILLSIIIIILIGGFLWVNNSLSDKPQTQTDQPAPVVASGSLPLSITVDNVNNDYLFPEIYLGNTYQIQADQMALWNAIFNDPNHPAESKTNTQNFVKTFIGTGLSNQALMERVKESTETGILNLIINK